MEFHMPTDDLGQSQPPAPEAKYVTAEEIGNIVNSAVSSHVKRLNIAGQIADAMKPVMDKLTAAPAPQPEDEGEKKKGKQSPELIAMSKQLEDMQKELKIRDEKVASAEKKTREERAYTELRGALEGKVRPELAEILAKHLFHLDNRVQFNDDGAPVFRVSRTAYSGAEPEDVLYPISAGVEDFLKTEAAKPFLPAPSAGAGATPLPKRPTAQGGPVDFSKPASTEAEKVQRARIREAQINERLNSGR